MLHASVLPKIFWFFRKNRVAYAVFSFHYGNYLPFERIATIRSPKAIIKDKASNTRIGHHLPYGSKPTYTFCLSMFIIAKLLLKRKVCSE